MIENSHGKRISPDEGPDQNEFNENLSEIGTPDNLVFNEEANSFEIDVVSIDDEYDHPDPYKTSVKNGGDSNSDFDEANSGALDHYQDNPTEIIDELGMHIDSGKIVEISPEDEELGRTPEDDRGDLDEEGYPKNLGKDSNTFYK
ncbi:MAG: hypothetical protein JWQ25_2202 [Daejeonella sp.]|nr:hypothetical protein [Daejeonella sp.]